MPRLHSGSAIDRPETTKLPPIPEVVWQQPHETQLFGMHKNSTTKTKRKIDLESQTSPIRETSPQVTGSDTGVLETKPGARQYNAPMTPRNNNQKSNEMKLPWQLMTVGMTTFPLPKY